MASTRSSTHPIRRRRQSACRALPDHPFSLLLLTMIHYPSSPRTLARHHRPHQPFEPASSLHRSRPTSRRAHRWARVWHAVLASYRCAMSSPVSATPCKAIHHRAAVQTRPVCRCRLVPESLGAWPARAWLALTRPPSTGGAPPCTSTISTTACTSVLVGVQHNNRLLAASGCSLDAWRAPTTPHRR